MSKSLIICASVLLSLAVCLAAAPPAVPPPADDCCRECRVCPQCRANAEAITFPPRSGWHLVYPVRVIDGDTVVFWWLVKDTARLHGINAPELRDPGGPEAAKFLEKLLLKKQAVTTLVHGRDKFGRALLDLYVGDETVAEIMIKNRHAKKWDGKGERP